MSAGWFAHGVDANNACVIETGVYTTNNREQG